jgi:cytosine/uracil/thiamine/allantoin permease
MIPRWGSSPSREFTPCRWYWYAAGFQVAGLLALEAGVIPCVSGSLATVGMVEAMPFWTDLYHHAWFLSFGTSSLVYAGLTLRRPGGDALPRRY